jgi:DNA-directed RNA polymerase beta subunit
MIRTEVIPHVGDDPKKKAVYLASARILLLTQLGVRPADDRDSYICKRINAPGASEPDATVLRKARQGDSLSSRATSGIVGRATSELYQIDEHRKIIKSSTIESGMKSALMTGNWGSRTPRKSQVLNRITYCATLSHLRRVSTNIDKNSKLIQPRSSTALSGVFFRSCGNSRGAQCGIS